MRTEDQVRNEAGIVLGFTDAESNVQQGTGQITTFKQLGFKGSGSNHKPDGWYLPNKHNKVAIILETKAEGTDLSKKAFVDELMFNVNVALVKYSKVIGILYNGTDIRIFKEEDELENLATTLQNKTYYISLYENEKIDKQLIYRLTKQINDSLHVNFGIKNLYHRMIFTACALVAKRYGALLSKGMKFEVMKASILDQLGEQLANDRKQNAKLELLTEVYNEIKMNNSTNQEAIDNFISSVSEISSCINSNNWHGEDVMGIFFNEFNRYKKKSETGQIFTPDHITSFMYRLIDVHKNDNILDAACGSGAFLVKSMCNMIKEAGGVKTKEAKEIKEHQLYGIEFDREIFALACANMLIHKDGKTNITQMDSRSEEAKDWIKSKPITKVLMNPPFERKYGCLTIVKNVLDSVPVGTQCAFILPDKKLEKDMVDKTGSNKLLRNHRLKTIIKLPENLFNAGVVTSIFVFDAGIPQNGRNIIGYYMENDGLETVKNQGRQDTKDRWKDIENYWIDAIIKGEDPLYNSRQIIDPNVCLSYRKPEPPFEIFEEDFVRTMMDHELLEQGYDPKIFEERVLRSVLLSGKAERKGRSAIINIDF